MDHFEFNDYLALLKRRKWQLLVPFTLLLVLSIALAFGLPPVYQSTATILIEQQEIPTNLVASTVNSYAAERIQIISKRIMTRVNLLQIAKKYKLFERERTLGQTGELIAQMRENINVEMVSADVLDPKRGRQSRATIAFNLSFDYSDPESAQAVARELVSLFLSENQKIRRQRAQATATFLGDESRRLSQRIADLEAKLAAYKERNVGRLPEQMQMNMSLMERTERELEETERQLYTLEERKAYLESQLAQIKPHTGTNPAARLRELEAQYLTASAAYAQDHPDMVKMRSEIALLKAEVGDVSSADSIQKQLNEVRGRLAQLQEKYSASHPDIVKLKGTEAALEKALATAGTNNADAGFMKPDNPPYLSVQTQLETINIQLKAQVEKRKRLKRKLSGYEDRLIQTPRVEQEGLALKRNYESAVKKFHELKQKELQATVSEQLEKEKKGERFSVVEPPQLPDQPIKPNRLGILLLGTVLSFAGGLGTAALTEFFDRSLHGPKSVMRLFQEPPLAVIPYVDSKSSGNRARGKLSVVSISMLGLAGAGHVAPLWLQVSSWA